MTLLRPRMHPLLAFSLATALVTLVSFTPAFAADVKVSITNFKFDPEVVTAAVGDKVIFTNADDTIHSVVGDDGSFHSDGLDTNDTYTYTVTKAGTIAYHCGLHPFMKGQIVVK